MNHITTVCVFCGANEGQKPIFQETAATLGQELVRRNIDLVYGGGSVGLMGVVAKAVLNGGRHVTGIIPGALKTKELAGEIIGELIVVDAMHERKALMVRRSDAFLAMPGGFGTLDELFEVVTWGQLGIHNKPIGLLNVDGYFDPIVEWIDRAVEQGFVRGHHRGLVVVADTPAALLDLLALHRPPLGLVEWMKLNDT